ncbi:MAG: calcium-binding protein, partial [Alphaproteobacteria bacterium]|nr:calcium-binding protein [Alphaproteobacteria bacterium]
MADDNILDGETNTEEEQIIDQPAGDEHSAFMDDEELHDQLPNEGESDDRTALTAAHQGSRATSTPADSSGEFTPAVDEDLLGAGRDRANQRSNAANTSLTDAQPGDAVNGFQDGLGPDVSPIEGEAAQSSRGRGGRSSEASTDQNSAAEGSVDTTQSDSLQLADSGAGEDQIPLSGLEDSLNGEAPAGPEPLGAGGPGGNPAGGQGPQGGQEGQDGNDSSDQNASGGAAASSQDEEIVEIEPETAPPPVVADVNDGPSTADASASGAEDAASISVTITGSDVDGTVDSFSLSSLPTNGTLYTDDGLTTVATTGTDYTASGGSLTLYFVPDGDYNGVVTFDYAAKDDDGAVDAADATATITVTEVVDTIQGTPGDDNLVGTAGADLIKGLGGDDTMAGGAGNDTLQGQAGADALDGGTGSDTATYQGSGQAVNVNLTTGTGTGGDAQGDTLTDIENLTGSGNDDTLTGDGNANVIDGDAGDDSIDGGAGADTLTGGSGQDTLIGGAGADVLDGGTGSSDAASYESSAEAVGVDLSTGTGSGGDAAGDTLTTLEDLIGSANDDTLTGDANDNIIDGGAGADILTGGDG